MSAYRDEKTSTGYVFFYYKDHTGANKGKTKRGFKTKREDLEWQENFKSIQNRSLDMKFSEFVNLYHEYIRHRIKHNTWLMKQTITEQKILPYFGKMKINEIQAVDVTNWQNEILSHRDKNGEPYSPTYLKTIHNQLSAIFNYAVRFYDLRTNPAAKAGNMGKETSKEMLFWTKAEYMKFSEAVMDKPMAFYAFEVLYWTGIRVGELLALTPADIDLENRILKIRHSYQRLEGKDYITSPKTVKSNRNIVLPKFLVDELEEYINSLYKIGNDDRIFTITKGGLRSRLILASEKAGVKPIRIHDLRHSHVSLLIDKGFSAIAIADRLGHESIDITYRYAHLFPSVQTEMAHSLETERDL